MTIKNFILKHIRNAIGFVFKSSPNHDLIITRVNRVEDYIRDFGFIKFFPKYIRAYSDWKNVKTFDAELGITAILKNEAPYIKEWIEFHKSVGVEKFFLFDNESTDNIKEILQPYIDSNEVTYTYIKGKQKQFEAYQMSIEQNRNKVKYMALIDIDEFITPIKHKTIPEFIKYLENKIGKPVDAVGINWLVHGFNGHKTTPQGPVRENFPKFDSKSEINRHIKSIVNPRSVVAARHPHYFIHLAGAKIVNARGDDMYGPFTGPYLDEIVIHHYWTKSYEEYLNRCQKGKADGSQVVKIDYSPDFLSVETTIPFTAKGAEDKT